jgi:hypothetical protein
MPDSQPSPTVMARVIGDEIARRDINQVRELRLLAELGVDQRIDARIEQRLNDWKVNNLNRELEELICLVAVEIRKHFDERFQAFSEQLKTVGHYVGQWKPGQLYHRHQVVTHAGSLYFCQAECTWAAPAEGEIEWQLRVRGVPADDEIPRPAPNGNGLAHDH